MKKLITLTALGVILATPAIAASKCIPMLSRMSGTIGAGAAPGASTFQVLLNPMSPSQVTFEGLANCSSTVPSSSKVLSATSTILMTDGDYCWCKIISPAVSNWYTVARTLATSNCQSVCAQKCADTFKNTSGPIDAYASDFWTGY